MERRKFVKQAIGAGVAVNLPFSLSAFEDLPVKPIRIGMVADVHQDVVHDGVARLRFFMEDMKQRKPDFIIQLGDFSLPHNYNQPFLDIWNEFNGPRYHVLGNHDMRDHGYTRELTMEWWGMEKRYYSFDYEGFHFIVLDGNDPNPKPWSGYDRYINTTQQQWLKADLDGTKLPVIVFSHQSLEDEDGVANKDEVRQILENARSSAGRSKVMACFSGHHHIDFIKEINGIHYVQVNSMSYKWVGGKYARKRFAEHIEQAYPHLRSTCLYKDPLYTVLTIDPGKQVLQLEGRSTEFVAPTPHEIGVPWADEMHPTITERNISFG